MEEITRLTTIRETHEFFGISEPHHPLISIIDLNDEIINRDFGDQRFLFDFYQISLKRGFSGSMTYGRNSYDFEDGSLTFIKAGQVIKMESMPQEVKGGHGWTILFHPDLIRKSPLGKTIEEYSFFDYDINEALHLSSQEIESLNSLVLKIREEYLHSIDKYSQELINGNLEMLLKYSKRYYDRQFYTRSDMNKDLLQQFHSLIKHYYNSEKPKIAGGLTVSECALSLNLSVNYFGDLIKAETGISAKEHIHDYVINKAKSMLLASNDGIGQIAYSLGYEYPQGFNKLFKARVGISPKQFRTIN